MGATGLAPNPADYRVRLREQTDEQLDAWAAELLRDVAKRRGVVRAVADFRRNAHLDEKAFRRVFARGGGAPQTISGRAGCSTPAGNTTRRSRPVPISWTRI